MYSLNIRNTKHIYVSTSKFLFFSLCQVLLSVIHNKRDILPIFSHGVFVFCSFLSLSLIEIKEAIACKSMICSLCMKT